MAPHPVFVIGAGYAGRMALGRLRIALPEHPLVLVDPHPRPTRRIELHAVAAGARPAGESLATLCRRLGAIHRPTRARRVGPGAVELADGTVLDAAAVVVATGSRTRPAPGPAHVLDTPAGAVAIARALARNPEARVTVVGAGSTGIETALSLAARHRRARITLWRACPGFAGFGHGAEQRIEHRLDACGVEVVDGGAVTDIDVGHARSAAHQHRHDLLVWCAGFQPCPVAVDGARTEGGALVTDAALQVVPGVFAAGDAAAHGHRLGCATAMPSGAHAAANIVRHLRGEALAPFAFRDVATTTALDPGRGVLQPLAPDGSPTHRALGGRLAGLAKAGILAAVEGTLVAEARLQWPLYTWLAPRSPALPVAA